MIRYVIFSSAIMSVLSSFFFFFFNDTATTEIYTLSLHDALPIYKRTRIYQCLACGKQFSTTSGTIFNDTHLPLTKWRSEEHTSELQSRSDLVCRLLLEKKKRTRLA